MILRVFNAAARYILGFTIALSIPTCFALAPDFGWKVPVVCFGVFWLSLFLLSFTTPPRRRT